MTAVIIWGEDRGIHIATDGAGLMPDGKARLLVSKTVAVPHLKLALTVRGSMRHMMVAQSLLPMAGETFDQVRANAQSWARKIKRNSPLCGHFDLLVAGVSETSGPTAWMISSHNRHFHDVEAWETLDLGTDPVIFPGFPDEQFTRFTYRHALVVMERQRTRTLPTPSGWLWKRMKPRRVAGAFVQMTSIKPDGAIMQWIAQRWDEAA